MTEVERNRAAQVEVYGEQLAEIFARLTEGFGLTQGGLAKVLGMSPPMLSQLGSGHRVKIGNPAVQRRLEEVQQLLEEVHAGSVPTDGIPDRLEQIRESAGAWTTTRRDLTAGAPADQTVREALLAVSSAEGLLAAAQLLDGQGGHRPLAALLRKAAQPQR